MNDTATAAFERLLDVAERDTHQSRKVRRFILAWWNAAEHGGFDPADLFSLDTSIAQDIASIVYWLANAPAGEYPTAYRSRIEKIIQVNNRD